jgi:hypothetical protein
VRRDLGAQIEPRAHGLESPAELAEVRHEGFSRLLDLTLRIGPGLHGWSCR